MFSYLSTNWQFPEGALGGGETKALVPGDELGGSRDKCFTPEGR